MKNIQVIDDAVNCTYDVFSISDQNFNLLFPNSQDIEFEDDAIARLGVNNFQKITSEMWAKRLDKKQLLGIHGTLFYGLHCEDKKPFYPTKNESEMIANP